MKRLTYEEYKQLHKCKHVDNPYVYKVDAIGRKRYAKQCQKCGIYEPIKDIRNIPNLHLSKKFIYGLYDDYGARLYNEYLEYLGSLQENWRKVYNQYMQTDDWKEKRSIILKRDKNTCQGCGQYATQVHHLDYANLKDELYFQLIAVCETCHFKLHKERENVRDPEHKCD